MGGIVLVGGQGLHAVQVAGEAHAVGSKPLVKADVGRAQAGDGPHHSGEGLLEKALGFAPVGVFLGQIPEDHMSDHTLQLLCDIVAQQSGKGKSAAYCEMDKKRPASPKAGR